MNSPSRPFQIPGRLYLMVAILIFGTANAVVRKLTDIGADHLIDGDRNPISFCNVLFAGNLCALIIFAIAHQHQWRRPILRTISRQQWLILTVLALLGTALVPTLVFMALEKTPVTNVVLIGQIDTPLVLALSVLCLGEKTNRWVIGGSVVFFVGVALTVLLQPAAPDMVTTGMGVQIGVGELLVLAAAVGKAINNLISKVSLKQIPLGIFNVYRMFVGTLFFFVVTLGLYGPEHFMDVTSPFLWQWMFVYGAVIVVGGQLAWFQGLTKTTASEVTLATAFNPIAGVLAAFLLLGEVPTSAQYIGGVVILVGIVLNQLGVRRLNQAKPPAPKPLPPELCDAIAFKGI